ncbi:MAG TPA: LEA type 2 family protein [Longimicrobium sp.]|nr:LEA type 2 family protein [Longimicrobium sp.]
MAMTKKLRRAAVLIGMLPLLSGCATLAQLGIQAPQFYVDQGQPAQLRLLAPGFGRPQGGAAIRLYARVRNPNPIGITLSRLAGGLVLEGRNAAQVDFPLGVPMQGGAETVVPLDISVNFNDIPGLADVLLRAATGQSIRYALRGTVGVDAGVLGQPTFGPMNLLEGSARVGR